jgi:hypothetical protein
MLPLDRTVLLGSPKRVRICKREFSRHPAYARAIAELKQSANLGRP